MMMSSSEDCFGSPPPETEERIGTSIIKNEQSLASVMRKSLLLRQHQQQQQEQSSPSTSASTPHMRFFGAPASSTVVVTPTITSATTTITPRNTSVRATRGAPSVPTHQNDPASPRQFLNNNNNSSSTNASTRLQQHPLEQQQQHDDGGGGGDGDEEAVWMALPTSLLPHWCCLMLCSILALAAVAAGTPLTLSSSTAASDSNSDGYFEDMQMCMAISTLSLLLTFVASSCYLLIPEAFVGTLYEVTVIGLNIIFWSGCLPIIMNPRNNLAVQGTSIVNGNLFFLSWICFGLSWVVLKHVLEQYFIMDSSRIGTLTTPPPNGYSQVLPMTSSRLAHLMLLLSSLVVTAASSRDYKQQVCTTSQNQLCQRLSFVLSTSVISFTGLCISWMFYFFWKRNNSVDQHRPVPSIVRLVVTILFSTMWMIATSLGTYGQHAPAHEVGNLFGALWISFLLSLFLTKKALREYLQFRLSTTRANCKNNNNTGKNNNGRGNSISRLLRAWAPRYKTKKDASSASVTSRNVIPGLVQEENDEIELHTSSDVEEGISVSETAVVETPMATPRYNLHAKEKHPQTESSAAGQTHTTIAMSLDETFENNYYDNSPDGLLLRKVSTEQTVHEDFEDEMSIETTRRGNNSPNNPADNQQHQQHHQSLRVAQEPQGQRASQKARSSTLDRRAQQVETPHKDFLMDPEDF